MSQRAPDFSVIGAGLAGSLLAVELAQRGHTVKLHEQNPDPRQHDVPAGRSINLALAERGRAALRRAGLLERVDAFSLPMAGRMLHDREGATRFQRYGQRDDEVIWSVHRCELNKVLLDATESCGVSIEFERRLEAIDFDQRQLSLSDPDGAIRTEPAGLIIGADGAGSAVRRAMAPVRAMEITEAPLGHGYRELTLPPGPHGEFRLAPDALHIWPRGGFMMIALPNPDGSFTCTLFLAREAAQDDQPSFSALSDRDDMMAFLEHEFPDAVALIDDLEAELESRPIGFLGTLYVDPWHLDDRAVLIGDAAHAIVPFHGQGMNSAFEDVRYLVDQLDRDGPTAPALHAFYTTRKPNADAIATMALENYIEMRDQVRDPQFQLMKELAWALESRLGDQFTPRYQMVMFRDDIPYAEAKRRGDRQRALLKELIAGKTALDEIDLDDASRQALDLVAA